MRPVVRVLSFVDERRWPDPIVIPCLMTLLPVLVFDRARLQSFHVEAQHRADIPDYQMLHILARDEPQVGARCFANVPCDPSHFGLVILLVQRALCCLFLARRISRPSACSGSSSWSARPRRGCGETCVVPYYYMAAILRLFDA